MSLDIKLSKIIAPELEFAGPGYFHDPRTGLVEAGPFDLRFGSAHRTQVRVAIVGTKEMIDSSLHWFDACKNKIVSRKNIGGVMQDIVYPGFDKIFHSELVIDPNWTIVIDDQMLNNATALRPYEAFENIVQLFSRSIKEAKRNYRPDLVICAIPDLVERKYWSVRRPFTQEERAAARRIEKNSQTGQFELPFDWQPDETTEDLLTRDLRRALKAKAMEHEIPIQLVRNNTLKDLRSNEDPATRAWNITVGMYYKSGGIPWRMSTQGPDTCFVGITFHHLRTTKRQLVFSSLAQAFSSNGEGFALKGSILEPDKNFRRTPRLSRDQAYDLSLKVLNEYQNRNGTKPQRIVLHKTSRFSLDEQDGIMEALSDIPIVRMVTLAPSSIRFVTHSNYPPSRGTLININDDRHLLFTSGYIENLNTYPGPHIPVPLEIILHGDSTTSAVHEAASEILALGRLNWNTSDLRSSQPVTLGFARRVGGIMAEYGLNVEDDPDPNYRYYM